MAKADWVKISPASGSGNTDVNVSSHKEHTGRLFRTTTLTWKAANVTDIVRTVHQAGKPEYVNITDSASVDKLGKLVTITGVSNSKKLTFYLGIGDLDISLPNTYIANSITTSNGSNIVGDPGAIAEYIFSIPIIVPANNTEFSKTKQIIVTDEAGNRDTCTITSTSEDAYIIIAEGNIELDYRGNPVTVKVESNTDWRIV